MKENIMHNIAIEKKMILDTQRVFVFRQHEQHSHIVTIIIFIIITGWLVMNKVINFDNIN